MSASTAQEMHDLLKLFNSGIKSVEVTGPLFCVSVGSKRAAHGVKLDLLRSMAFRSVTITQGEKRGYLVHAVVNG